MSGIRRVVIIAVAIASMLVVAGCSHSGRKSNGSRGGSGVLSATTIPPPTVPVPVFTEKATHDGLIVVRQSSVEQLDLDTGERRPLDEAGRFRDAGDRLDLVRLAARLVVWGDNNTGAGNVVKPVYATSLDMTAKPVVLGQAEGAMPSATFGKVWLISDTLQAGKPTSMVLVDAVSGRVVSRHSVPVGRAVLGVVAGGVLSQSLGAPAALEVFDVERGRVARHIADSGDPIAFNQTHVAWRANPCTTGCAVHMVSLTSPASSSFDLPADMDTTIGSGVFDPTSSRIAMLNSFVGNDPRANVVIIDVANGKQQRPAGAVTQDVAGNQCVWGRSGRWLYCPDASRRGVLVIDTSTGAPSLVANSGGLADGAISQLLVAT
jgi:hypothetical protein